MIDVFDLVVSDVEALKLIELAEDARDVDEVVVGEVEVEEALEVTQSVDLDVVDVVVGDVEIGDRCGGGESPADESLDRVTPGIEGKVRFFI